MYKRILIPVDGSETSNKALNTALQLARDLNATVRVVHLVDESAYLSSFDPYGTYTTELISVMREGGIKVLDDAMAVAKTAGIQADQMLFDKFGERLGETVASAAKLWNADLIVVGSHGRRGIGRLLLGSGAEQIMRLAPVPVLVVRSEPEEAKPAAA